MDKNPDGALRKYEMALQSCPTVKTVSTILSNAAQTYLKLDDAIGACCCAAAALTLDPTNEKARFRYDKAKQQFPLTPTAAAPVNLTKCIAWVTDSTGATPTMPGTSEELRLQGNEAFGRGHFPEAIACYFSALSHHEDIAKLLSNMNMACQRLHLMEESVALYGAIALILRVETPRSHALRYKNFKRCLMAMLHLRLPDIDPLLAKLDSGDDEVHKMRNATIFDFENCNLPSVLPQQLSEFVHPQLQVRAVTGKGRGLVLGAAVRAGEVLLCAHAATRCDIQEFEKETQQSASSHHVYNCIKFDSGDIVMTRHLPQRFSCRGYSRVQRAYFQLGGLELHVHCPASLDTFEDLRPRLDFPMLYDLPIEAQTTPFDLGHAMEIDANNAFRCDAVLSVVPQTMFSGVFVNPSLMNHSDARNTLSSFYGDWMLVRAGDDLPAGTEITTSYGTGSAPLGYRGGDVGNVHLAPSKWPFLSSFLDEQDEKEYAEWISKADKVIKLQRSSNGPAGSTIQRANLKCVWSEVVRWAQHRMRRPPIPTVFYTQLRTRFATAYLKHASTAFPWDWDMVSQLVLEFDQHHASLPLELATGIQANAHAFVDAKLPERIRRKVRAATLTIHGTMPQR